MAYRQALPRFTLDLQKPEEGRFLPSSWVSLCLRVSVVERLNQDTPSFFITFFLYRHHRPAPQSVRRSLDSAPSRTAPVSRDERISGRKLFTCSLTKNGPGQHTRKCTPNRKIKR
jgi:hypothetical protein